MAQRLARLLALLIAVSAVATPGALRAEQARADIVQPLLLTRIAYVGKRYPEPPPLSLIDKILTDKGIQGARLAIRDSNLTARLLNQQHELVEAVVEKDADAVARARDLLAGGHRVLIADLEATDLLRVADLTEARDAIIFSIRDESDALRQADCRANVFHLPPYASMRTDALGQYLYWKKWQRWLLVVGKAPADQTYAAAIRRAAGRFGSKIVEERTYAFDAGSRRTDTGHQQIQTQMPLVTQGAPEHDVVFVADAAEAFGDYLPHRTSTPRPVVGTHGLVAVGWHRAFEQYAATQMQNSFEEMTDRVMTERDYYGWLAVRIVAEAVLRTSKNDTQGLRDYLLSDKFGIAAFKGQALTFRRWDHQLRQPLLVANARALVTMAPQDGFLHPKYLTDTLGYDEPETKCRFKS